MASRDEEMMLFASISCFVRAERLQHETAFIEDAVHELLKARRLLKFSYVYGFYLEDGGYKKTIFEMMQVFFSLLPFPFPFHTLCTFSFPFSHPLHVLFPFSHPLHVLFPFSHPLHDNSYTTCSLSSPPPTIESMLFFESMLFSIEEEILIIRH